MSTKRRIAAAEARATLKDVVDEVKNKKTRVKITRYGKTAAYLVPKEDGHALEECKEELDSCAERKRRK
jgi:prevent-host-death family protein